MRSLLLSGIILLYLLLSGCSPVIVGSLPSVEPGETVVRQDTMRLSPVTGAPSKYSPEHRRKMAGDWGRND